MVIFLILLAGLIIYGIRFTRFHDEYLSPDQCTAVRGVFAVIIFLSHARDYLELGNSAGNALFTLFFHIIGQSMVSIYFFYSGYGVLVSYQRKDDYARQFLLKRIIKTLVHFDLAVLLYILLNLCFGRIYSMKTYLLSMIGLASIGNSNWFIFVILALYGVTWISFVLMKILHIQKKEYVSYMVVILSGTLWFILHRLSFGGYWYNTLLCYPAGMLYGMYKEKIDESLKNSRYYVFSMCAVIGMMVMCYVLRGGNIVYSVYSLLFALAVVIITMKVKKQNDALLWIGKHSFSIYILQRIPMTLLKASGVNNAVAFTAIAWICTAFMAYCFEKLLNYIDRNVMHC